MSSWDVIIIGAGISGVDAAYRVKERLPHLSFTILEARHAHGGTWDLFKYPGVRSDSDMFTFSYPFNPWTGSELLTSASNILAYINDTLDRFDLRKHIQYNQRVEETHWSSKEQQWRLTVQSPSGANELRARFVYFSTGYYDYHQPLDAQIPGLNEFGGTVIHPQFWPEDFDHANKRITVIGSGATAATLIPNLASTATEVVMLQRSPSYFVSAPNKRHKPGFFSKLFPAYLLFRLTRFQLVLAQFLLFWFCRAFPQTAQRLLYRRTQQSLPKGMSLDPHFTPSYYPWDQRLCVTPDGDFFQCLANGKARVVTDRIKTVTKTGIELESGERLQTDVIVTATGLQLLFAGGAKIYVDGKESTFKDHYFWRGLMLNDIPNACFVFGYPNASWTLGADLTAVGFTRLVKQVEAAKAKSATPVVAANAPMDDLPLVSLSSTYIDRGSAFVPRTGSRKPWLPRRNYFADYYATWFGDLHAGLVYSY